VEFNLNDDMTSYSIDELTALAAQANERLDVLLALDAATPAEVAEAESLDAALTRIAAEQTERSSATERMAALREARATAANQNPETDEDDEARDAESDDEDEDENDSEDAADDTDSESEEDEDDTEGGAVTASTTSTRKRLAKKTPRPVVKETEEEREKTYAIVAAADVSGIAAGSDIPDIDALTAAVMARAKSLPSQPPAVAVEGAPLQRFGVAQIVRTDFADTVSMEDHEDKVFSIIASAGSEKNLDGGSLIAAGGWCAPSEINYDLCDIETTDGLIDLPTIGVKRGGMRYTSGPDFTGLYNATGIQTEVQAIAGTTKTCYTVTCPPFTEVRLDAIYLCLKFGFLQNAAYPELTKNVVQRALIAHEHRMSADTLGRMVGLSGAAIAVPAIGSTAYNTLSSLELIIESQRGLYRLGLGQTLEVVVPHWVRAALRADYSLRTGVQNDEITDAVLARHFAARGGRVQYVYNWQPLPDNALEYPATFDMLVYPAGAFVRGTADVITLENVYDAASISANEYTGLFTEQGNLVVKNCLPSKLLTVPVCNAGRTGAANIVDCNTVGA